MSAAVSAQLPGVLGVRFLVVENDVGHRAIIMQVAPIPDGAVEPLPSAIILTGSYESAESFMVMISNALDAAKLCWPEAISSSVVVTPAAAGGLPQ